MKRHLPLLVLLHVRTSERLIKDLASFLPESEQISTTIPKHTTRNPRKQKAESRNTNLQPLPLQHSNLPQRPIPLPKPLPRHPNAPLLLLLPQRHTEKRSIARYQQFQRRVGDLVQEDVSPLFVAEALLRVVEAEGVGLEGLFPGRRWFGGCGRVVGFDVPD